MKKGLLFLVIFISAATSFFPEQFYTSIIGGLSLSHLFIGGFLLFFFNYNIRNFASSDWKIINSLLFLCLFGLLSAIWSPYPLIAAIFGIKLFFISNVFITVIILLKKQKLELKDIIKMAKIVIVLTIVGQIVGLILGVNVYGEENTSAGLSDNVSAIAGQLLFVTPLILLSKNNKFQKLFLFLIFIAILLTLRRSSLISFFLIIIIIFLYNFFSKKTNIKAKFKSLFSIVGAGILISVIFISTNIGSSFLNRVDELDPSQEGTASGRYNFQGGGIDYVLDRDFIPNIMGEGMGYSLIVNIENGFIPIGMHSDFLDIIIGLGFLGLIGFLLFYYRVFKISKRYTPGTPNFNSGIALLVALGSISLFSGGFFNINTIPGYIALAYIYADAKYNLKNSTLRKINVSK
ncbi:hypothetical protein ITJ86_01285 [Winogradskyella sp. F6397]|uniref:O-antigen ligase-related domain-containing protein n=1 Tax=Winogradskyella marina TaxID=2785530 RepID=A0ABS0EDP3_9FLAO|nr:O-antigen ligase family protein [Winogradskyella marina]MBF8148509.1 hypothetical protein [Winogradskyella marina]